MNFNKSLKISITFYLDTLLNKIYESKKFDSRIRVQELHLSSRIKRKTREVTELKIK